jgi:hypothetical protein
MTYVTYLAAALALACIVSALVRACQIIGLVLEDQRNEDDQ